MHAWWWSSVWCGCLLVACCETLSWFWHSNIQLPDTLLYYRAYFQIPFSLKGLWKIRDWLQSEWYQKGTDILGLALFELGSFFYSFRGLKCILDQLSESHITHSSPIIYFFQLSFTEKPDYLSDVHFTKALGQVKSELCFPLLYFLWSSTNNDENKILFIAMCPVESLVF